MKRYQCRLYCSPGCPTRLDQFERDWQYPDVIRSDERFGSTARHGGGRHARRRDDAPLDSGSDRRGYQCGKCGAHWQFTSARLHAALTKGIDSRQRVVYASDIERMVAPL